MREPERQDSSQDLINRKILVAVCGGIAAYKVVELVRRILKNGSEVRVMMTQSATEFIGPATFAAITGHKVGIRMFDDDGAASTIHLDMSHWADMIIIAPATANIIAKMASGIADDLVSTSLLAAKCPVLIAPAMNDSMYQHPATQANLETLKSRGNIFVGPEYGEMASPDEKPGLGRMSEPDKIENSVLQILKPNSLLAGKKVVITSGRTEEALDPVRVLTNRSSGRMGVALAEIALEYGAEVVMVNGKMDLPPPPGVSVRKVLTADEMLEACKKEIPSADIVFYSAAVADWKPKYKSNKKIKREDDASPVVELEKNPDISAITSSLGDGIKIGFALEETNDIETATQKLERKQLNAILLNTFNAIGSQQNRVSWIDGQGEVKQSENMDKKSLADWIMQRVLELIDEA
ncbi:MAG: bifunctional phosphopantothenoylcysteine decarboxylase/phosphopantothenate--cysteine ligase CoaBC [Candidatus Electryonea clarkiae]|nr:bifunctional phosphopantothenoylcysteine decarboxylase/phosphopantothenate--cysteine ligase CoaBC [Candidatus Electryonea clarkiae]MDP8287128.1 bifunctional phosphopantothenoylcysteine decarboxylase/phosphopantothenate--cysteine ligase CoaBC [Candidatus Electryonea clarkiae]